MYIVGTYYAPDLKDRSSIRARLEPSFLLGKVKVNRQRALTSRASAKSFSFVFLSPHLPLLFAAETDSRFRQPSRRVHRREARAIGDRARRQAGPRPVSRPTFVRITADGAKESAWFAGKRSARDRPRCGPDTILSLSLSTLCLPPPSSCPRLLSSSTPRFRSRIPGATRDE